MVGHAIWKQVDSWSIESLETMERIGDWSSGADDVRVENTKTVTLDVQTNDNIDGEKMWTSRGISDSTACMIQCMRSWWKIVEVVQVVLQKNIFEWTLIT